jgi:phospholipid/cholesterol/gamma-HCH transport system substrate-binding protein
METRANYVLIGVFTLAVIAGAFGFVWWFERASDKGARVSYEIVFDGSVSGLRPGSAVLFNGIRVGEVASMSLDPSDPSRVITRVGVSPQTPIRADTRAGLEYQGLTGIASVALTGGQQSSPPIAAEPGQLPRITAEAGQMQDLLSGAKQIMGRVDSIVMKVDRLLATNEKKLNQVVDDVSTFTNVLSKRSSNIDTLLVDASELARKLNGQADRLDGILKNVESFTGGGDKAGFMTDLSEAAKSVRALADSLSRSAPNTLKDYQSLAADARRAVGEIERVARNIGRDPRGFLFGGGGGSSIPTYSGR